MVGQSELWRIGISAIPDNQITCPPVSVGFGLLQGLVTTLLIRQVTETLTITLYDLHKRLGHINYGYLKKLIKEYDAEHAVPTI